VDLVRTVFALRPPLDKHYATANTSILVLTIKTAGPVGSWYILLRFYSLNTVLILLILLKCSIGRPLPCVNGEYVLQ
jgi:hypothetical protein